MVIDFHTHVFPAKLRDNRARYAAADVAFAMLYADPKARMATADELIASMDEAGIEASMIVNYGWATHELCVETNDYILESAVRFPGRLFGFCAVQPDETDKAVKEIERCARAGARGIGELRPDIQLKAFPDTSRLVALGKSLKQHNLMLMLHASEPVGHQYPGKGDFTPGLLYQVIGQLPDVTIVCAHFGGGLPFYALMPEVKKTLKNVYFDSAASPYLYQPQVFARVADMAGADHVLFGTDWPLMPPARILIEIDAVGLTAEAKNQITSGNARRLLNL
ncbi:amidohydrolase family protein [Chloroflexota bacterium]